MLPALTWPVFSAGWSILSGVAVMLLGLVTVVGGKSRTPGGFAFSLFAMLWGVTIAFANVATIAPSKAVAEVLYLVAVACWLPVPYLLATFTSTHAPRLDRRRPWTLVRTVMLLFAVIAVLILFARPVWIYGGTFLHGSRWLPVWGPAYAITVSGPFFAAVVAALWGLRDARERAATPRIRKRAGLMFMGLSLYASFVAGNELVYFSGAAFAAPNASNILHASIFVALAASLLYMAVKWFLEARSLRGRDRQLSSLLAGACSIPFLWGVAEGFLVLGPLPALHTIGIWRLGSVAILAYGLAHWRTHDLPQRTARGTATAAGITGSFAGGAAGWGIGTLAFANPLGPIAMGLLFMGATVAPLVKFARRLVPQRWQTTAPGASEALYGQKIDAYRAALEASLARGTLHDDREFLFALKERFGITDDEERILMHLARTSVLVPSKGDTNTIYEKLRLLGEGGSGRTWLVRDRVQERLVVLKEPLERWQNEPTLRERVLREARLAAKVRHPNVVQIEEVVESKDNPIIVMEHIDGGSLLDLVRDQGVLPWRQATDILQGVLDGLEAVHATGIIHRDIKPSNILLTSDGEAKLSDFGIALPAASTRTLIDPKDAGAGTRAYMAPEMLSGRSTGTRQSDVYACAAMLYECLYGAPPTPHSVVFAQKDIPLQLIAAIERGLSERPEDRFPSVKAFAEALRQAARA